MSLTCSVFVATSLDGCIARENGSLDWLDAANETVLEGEDCGFKEFMESVDALVMGRNTFEQVLSFGSWPYGDKPVFVLTSREINIPNEISETVIHSSETPQELYERLSNDGMRRLYIDGGITIQRFLMAGLIDDIIVTIIPVALGSGKPLFGRMDKDLLLKHIDTKVFEFGFVQIKYQAKKNA